MIQFLPVLAIAERLQNMIDQAEFQVVGMLVVFSCLGFLALILGVSGSLASAMDKRKATAAKAAVSAKVSSPAASVTGAVVPKVTGPVPSDLVAVIAAAVHVSLDGLNHRIVMIKPSSTGYGASGRAEIFASRRSITPQPRR